MATSYVRQSSFADGDTITAALFNDEFNRVLTAFSYAASSTTGHRHDGSAGEGGNIHTIGDQDFLNKILTTGNTWEFYVEVSSAAAKQMVLQDGALVPNADSDLDLGTSSIYFKDAYIDSITTTGNVAVGGNLTVTGTTTFNGGTLTLGNAADDNVVFGADVNSSIIPNTDDTYDLGSASQEWRDLYVDGTAYLDVINLAGTAITSTAAELNILDGVTSTAAELNILDGVTSTAEELNILDGVTSTAAELNILDGVTSTAAELNILDGVTSTFAELNILDGVTSTAAELNILDGVTSTAAELNILDGVTSTAAELNILDGVTSTTAELNILDGVTSTAAELNILDGKSFLDEDNLASDSATGIASQQSIKAYVDASGAGTMSSFILEDEDGTEVSISDAEEVKFIGVGLTTNWTDATPGSDADPFDLTFTIDAAQTGITSIYATDLIIGEDNQTAIDFGTVNEIDFKVDNAARLTLTTGALYPVTNNQIDLGTSSLEFKDAFFDGTVTADAFAGPLTGNVTGNVSGTALTVTQAAQSAITSLGTLTTLTVDSVVVNGANIGHADDTDLITVADGIVTVAGEVSLTTLDIGGTNVTSTAAELNILDGVTSTAAELNIVDAVSRGSLIYGNASAATALLTKGSADTVLTSDGTDIAWAAPAASGVTYVAKTGNYTASDLEGVLANTSSAAFTVTLPSSPSAGAQIIVADSGDAFGTNNLTVARNGSTIDGSAADFVLDITGVSVQFVYNGSTWRVYALVGGQGGNAVTAAGTQTLTNKTLTSPKINEDVAVTSTATELNLLDGVTSTTAELNILDGVTSTAAELNALDGITAVVGELNALDIGSTAVGTAVASKAVILDSNKDYTGMRNLTISGELDAGSLDVSGDVDVDGTLETDALSLNGTAVTSTAAELNILDGVTSTAAELNILDGVTSTAAELNLLDGLTDVGFKNIPQNSKSAAYTLVLGDAGKHILHPVGDNNARTFTIPANSSVAYPIGTAITFINMAAANVTIAITSDTLYLSDAGTTGSRTLAQYGSATAIKIVATHWVISGSGLT